jgi:hypothetical protein
MSMMFKSFMIAFVAFLASLFVIFFGPHYPEVWGEPLAQWLIYLVAVVGFYVSAVKEKRERDRT